MLLKEIPNLLPALAHSPIVESAIWEKDIKKILPVHLASIRKLNKLNTPTYPIDDDIAQLIKHVKQYSLNTKTHTALIRYKKPNESFMTSTQYISGLKKLPTEYRLAVIYGMELQLSAMRVASLTISQAYLMDDVSELARSALAGMVASINTPNAFWTVKDKRHVALDDLNEKTYEAFNVSWLTLMRLYRYMISDHYNPILYK